MAVGNKSQGRLIQQTLHSIPEVNKMKKNFRFIWIILIALVLLIPIPVGTYRDGGTRVYRAATYTVVDWNRMVTADYTHSAVRLYFPPKCYGSIGRLWGEEKGKIEMPEEKEFLAVITQIHGDTGVEVEPLEGSVERNSAHRITFGIENLQELPLYEGCLVSVKYDGHIMESYPAQIVATEWSLAGDWRQKPGEDPWVESEFQEMGEETVTVAGWITEIYADAFFLTVQYPETIPTMVRGTLDPQWNLGDYVTVGLDNATYSQELMALKGDLAKVSEYDPYSMIPPLPYLDTDVFMTTENIEDMICYKPVIYLYPQEEIPVNVELDLQGEFLCTYPVYQDGWTVTAQPDGMLTDDKGQTYSYLYWEGEIYGESDFSEGFCIPGEETAAFLEWALDRLGLNRREANEFIVYWLPLMEDNAYNLISFDTEAYEQSAQLNISPMPDTLIRVFMTWKTSEEWVDLPIQELTSPERKGFVAVEWGGAMVE